PQSRSSTDRLRTRRLDRPDLHRSLRAHPAPPAPTPALPGSSVRQDDGPGPALHGLTDLLRRGDQHRAPGRSDEFDRRLNLGRHAPGRKMTLPEPTFKLRSAGRRDVALLRLLE